MLGGFGTCCHCFSKQDYVGLKKSNEGTRTRDNPFHRKSKQKTLTRSKGGQKVSLTCCCCCLCVCVGVSWSIGTGVEVLTSVLKPN